MTTLLPSDTLAHALEKLTESHLPQLPVQARDDSSNLVGLVPLQEVLDAYSREVHAGRAETDEAASTSRFGFPL